MHKFGTIIFIGVAAAMLSLLVGGCATLKKGADAAFTIGGVVKPEYKTTLEQIRKAILADDPSPVEGYDFVVSWRYKGNVVDAKEIVREEMFIRTMNAADGFKPLPTIVKTESAADITNRDRLKEEIGAILDAAGITEGAK